MKFEEEYGIESGDVATNARYKLIYELNEDTFDVKYVEVEKTEYSVPTGEVVRMSYLHVRIDKESICLFTGVKEGNVNKETYTPGMWMCFRYYKGYLPAILDYEKLSEISSVRYLKSFLEDLKDYICEMADEIVGSILKGRA